jgi:hypothetical protein
MINYSKTVFDKANLPIPSRLDLGRLATARR